MRKGLRKGASLVIVMAVSLVGVGRADDAQMRSSLVKINNQLQAIQQLVNQAQAEQSANPRIRVHFDDWRGPDGTQHRGLRQDIAMIQAAIAQAVNTPSVEPRRYPPLNDDFIGGSHV